MTPLKNTHETHRPVFLNEVIEQAGEVQNLQWGLDATFGRGGHTQAMLSHWPSLKMVAMDQDRTAIEYGLETFKSYVAEGRLHFVHRNFSELETALDAVRANGAKGFDFVLFDLGVSSPQLDNADRGFSFYKDGPLDMRMDHRITATAEKLVNEADEEELTRVFLENGEVERPLKVVRAIVADRKIKPFKSTKQLADLIARVDGWSKKGFHPATQYFMALRLEVNREIEVLAMALPKAARLLNAGGRMTVITFHSLEDRLVKKFFRAVEDGEARTVGTEFGESVRRKATKPSKSEIADNPRARSAKLRAFRRFAAGEKKTGKNKYAHLIGRDKSSEESPDEA